MGVMRFQPTILFALFTSLFACDRVDDVAFVNHAAQPCGEGEPVAGDPADGEGHPYLYCDLLPGHDELIYDPYHPACELGCGYEYPANDDAHMLCGIPCDSDIECAQWSLDGNPIPVCYDRCYFLCDDDHACPSGLTCHEGECWAPIPTDPEPESEPEPEPEPS